MADNDDIFDVKVGDKLTPEQIRRAAGGSEDGPTETKAKKKNKQKSGKLQYPADGTTAGKRCPTKILFEPVKTLSSLEAGSESVDGVSKKFEKAKKITDEYEKRKKNLEAKLIELKARASDAKKLINELKSDAKVGRSNNAKNIQAVKELSECQTEIKQTEEALKVCEAEKASADSTLKEMGEGDKPKTAEAGDAEAPEMAPKTQPQVAEQIALYLPVGFAVNDAMQYTNVDLGMSGAAALNAFQSGSSVTGVVGQALVNGFKSIGDLFSGTTNGNDLAKIATLRASQSLVGKALPDELRGAMNLAAQVTINPNTRAMFKGVNLRQFQFQFKFIPVSEAEAEMVEAIIYRFRHYAFPEPINARGGTIVGYKYPWMFNIELTSTDSEGKEVQIGTKIKKCYLESIATNYNPSSMAYHKDGRPVEYDLSLTFKEDIALNRTDIEEGY
jgi:hypothetical protein